MHDTLSTVVLPILLLENRGSISYLHVRATLEWGSASGWEPNLRTQGVLQRRSLTHHGFRSPRAGKPHNTRNLAEEERVAK